MNKQIAAGSPGGYQLWLRWTLATMVGELAGFAVPAAVGAGAASLMLDQTAMAAALIVAGIGEGAALGYAHWLALRRAIPALPREQWVWATALAAGLAWLIGMLPSTIEDVGALNRTLLIVGTVVLGALFLCSIGGAQWMVLRRYIQRAGWWVLVNAIAWPAGVAIPFVGLSLLPDGAEPMTMLKVGILCGMLMGLVVGAITGVALIRLLHAGPIAAAPAAVGQPRKVGAHG